MKVNEPIISADDRGRRAVLPCGGLRQMHRRSRRVQRSLLTLMMICTIGVGAAAGASRETRRKDVARLVRQIQRADYEGDRASLMRLYQELAPFNDDPKIGGKVRYWRGFAVWRRALNGFNDSVDRSELEQDLLRAVDEFQVAAVKGPLFVDARVGAGACLLSLVFIYQKDTVRLREFLARASPLLKDAETAEPRNPRLSWVLGARSWGTPPEFGGSQEKAIEIYQKGLRDARARKGVSSDPLSPTWGGPELLMNLAWSNLNRSVPDLDAAERYARSALALVPYWHYVKDILLPQIAAAKARSGS